MRFYNKHERNGASFHDKIPHKEGKKPKEIHERMNGDVSPSYYQVKFWSKQFKWSRKVIEDNSHSGRPVKASSKEMCQKLEDIILQDRHVKVGVIAHELGISPDTVSSIIHSVLIMPKVNSRWVSRMLTPEQKACGQQFSEGI